MQVKEQIKADYEPVQGNYQYIEVALPETTPATELDHISCVVPVAPADGGEPSQVPAC